MKITRNFLLLLVFSLFIALGSGCRSHKSVTHRPAYHKKGMIISTKPSGRPPGQMKKAFGVKSAKAFAPGHNKSSKQGNPHNKPNKYNKGKKRK